MTQLKELEQRRLRWRARRGLLENDLIISRYLDKYETELTGAHINALMQLFELDDHELLDILLARAEPEGTLDTSFIHTIVSNMRTL